MKYIKALAILLSLTATATTILFFAAVGAIFLLNVSVTPTTSDTCDEFRTIDGAPWCLAAVHDGESIRVIRSWQ